MKNVYNSRYKHQITDTNGIKILARIAGTYFEDSLSKVYSNAQLLAACSGKANWLPGICQALFLSGDCYMAVENWTEALAYFRNAQMIAHNIGRKDLEARSLYRLANIYKELHNQDSAVFYKEQAFRLRQYLTSAITRLYLLNDVADDYSLSKKYDSALIFSREALRIAGDTKRVGEVSLSWCNLADKYADLNRNDSVLYCLRQGLKEAIADKDSNTLAIATFSLGDYYRRTGDRTKAVAYIRRAVNYSPPRNGLQYAETLSEMYAQLGVYDSALFYYRMYISGQNMLVSNDKKAERSREMIKAVFAEQLKAFKAEHDAKDKLRAKDKRRLALVTGFAVLLILLTFVFARSSQRHRMKNKTISRMAAELADKNKTIQSSLTEKEVLLKEIHHRVKNNLQVVSSLLNLQLSGIFDPVVQQAMLVSKSRIKAISLIHKQLYQNEDLVSVDFYDFSHKLFSQVAALYRVAHGQPALEQELSHISLHADTAIIISLILNELFTNSFKHAFGDRPDPQIRLHIAPAGPGAYRLVYSDNGPGLPAGFDAATAGTLGIMLIRNLSLQLKGSFGYDVHLNTFTIIFIDDKIKINNQ